MGVAPIQPTVETVEMKLKAGTITSSPLPIPRIFRARNIISGNEDYGVFIPNNISNNINVLALGVVYGF